MIVGNLNALPLAGLPPALRQILALPQATLQALSAAGRALAAGGLPLVLQYWRSAYPADRPAPRRISPAVGRYSGDAGGLRGD